ncbi:MAG TPA: Fe-S cluster assembly protein SufD [Candidatus Binatia bacterium]|jgi:Fe-S cluster assembly protein SufD|nr:Fe-S cluster assembly protein SufD [Candidatus Binatia bacterium]
MLATESKEQYLAAFDQSRSTRSASDPSWLEELREAGIASFEALGFPSQKNEAWKFTSVEPISSQSFVHANGAARSLDANEILSRSFVDAESCRLVFINGVYAPEFSRTQDLPAGVRVQSLAETVRQNDDFLSAHLGRYARHQHEAFAALNTAFVEDGAVIVVPERCRLTQPVYLVFASVGGERQVMSHPRILILLGAATEAKIVESYVGLNSGTYFCNALTELIGGPDALIEHYRLQQEGDAGLHVGTLEAELERGCQLTAHAVTLSGSLVRNNVHVVLGGEGAACVLNGLYLGDKRQHIDNYTEIEHAKPRASSLELYKGILGGSSHGVFNGKIIVHKDAQKSDARQTNKNLLLSANAAVNTKPQLEIYADDVKCSHGSTIGQLDADALFYLRTRGLGLEEARSILSFAFASDVVGRIKIDSLRQRLDDYLVARFRKP